MWTWGANGQLGNGTTCDPFTGANCSSSTPVWASGLSGVTVTAIVTARRAALFPEAARRPGEPGVVPGTREIVLPDYPYIMPYRVEGDILIILRVFHAARERWSVGPSRWRCLPVGAVTATTRAMSSM